jgi:hypothetical protein
MSPGGRRKAAEGARHAKHVRASGRPPVTFWTATTRATALCGRSAARSCTGILSSSERRRSSSLRPLLLLNLVQAIGRGRGVNRTAEADQGRCSEEVHTALAWVLAPAATRRLSRHRRPPERRAA